MTTYFSPLLLGRLTCDLSKLPVDFRHLSFQVPLFQQNLRDLGFCLLSFRAVFPTLLGLLQVQRGFSSGRPVLVGFRAQVRPSQEQLSPSHFSHQCSRRCLRICGKRCLDAEEKFRMKTPSAPVSGRLNLGFQVFGHSQRIARCLVSVCRHASIVDIKWNLLKESS